MAMEVHPASSVYRDNPVLGNKYTLDGAGGGSVGGAANVVRRTTRATAGVQRRRVIKKHIQQKYLLCGFAIHAFLSTPAYLYGNVVENDKDLVLRIWPAIVYQASTQICRSILEHLDAEYHGRSRETTEYRRVFLLATSISCVSLMVSGVFFSSAWVTISTTTQAISIVFYGFFAGLGSSIFIWRTHIILEAVRPREDKYVRRTIQLCGEAFCHFLSFVFTSLHTLYGSAQSIVLMSALLVNLIPLSLIITKHREGSITKRISMIKAESGFPPLHHQLGGRFTAKYVDQIDGIELQLPHAWRNPIMEQANPSAAAALMAAADSHCNYVLAADEAFVTFVNPNGVEIMEIIPEEDENTSMMMRSSTSTIDNYGKTSGMSASQTGHKAFGSNWQTSVAGSSAGGGSEQMPPGNLVRIQRFSRDMTSHLWSNLLNNIAKPLRRALAVPELYATSFLLSTDIFSYVMCLTVLPGLAFNLHAIKIAEIPFLYSLLAFPWMCFSLMTPRFGTSLCKRKLQWHTLGCVCKGMALIFISFSTSKLLLSVSAALLGFGQAVTSFLQDLVFKMSMSHDRWMAIRRPVHLTNGILILIWGGMAHWVVLKYTFQATVGLAGGLYVISTILWNLLFIFCNSKVTEYYERFKFSSHQADLLTFSTTVHDFFYG